MTLTDRDRHRSWLQRNDQQSRIRAQSHKDLADDFLVGGGADDELGST